jgi:hypothetical protein
MEDWFTESLYKKVLELESLWILAKELQSQEPIYLSVRVKLLFYTRDSTTLQYNSIDTALAQKTCTKLAAFQINV